MKHFKLFLALFAMLALGVGNAWGAEELKETITPKDNGSDSNTAFTTATALSNGFVSNAAIKAVTEVSKVYPGDGGWKFGSLSEAGKISFTLKTPISNVTKIVITAKQYNATKKTTLNCNNIGAKTLTTSFADYEYKYTTPTEVSTISLVSAKASSGDLRCYVKEIKIYAETTSGGSTEPVVSLTADPTTIDFGTVYEGATVADKTVAVNFENLNGSVTYSGLSTPFSATGDKITISADASTIGEHSQTLTIQSAADSKTVKVTVKMNVEAPFNGKKLGFDFVNHPTGWPVKSNATAGEYVYNLDDTDYTFKHSKSGDGVYVAGTSGTSGYLLIASGNTLGLPAIKGHKLVKVQGTLNNSGNPSTSASVSITDGTNTLSGGTALTWNTKGGIYTYSLSGTQANTMYYLSVSNKNLQMITLVLYYEECEKYALTITEPAVGTGTLLVKDGENTLTSGAEIYEGTKLTVTATPANGYEGGTVVVKDAVGNDVTATVYADGVLTMPAYAVTISATFDKKPCELLATPTVSAETTYSSATLSWGAVTNAAKYSVKVGAADAIETTETSYEVTGLTAETTYTYQVQAMAEAGQDTYCDSEVAESTFITTAAPDATLTLSKNGDTSTKIEGKVGDVINLPDFESECSKTFVGWDADENCNHAPTYAFGAEYTLAAETQTLYAVYADAEAGENVTQTLTISGQTTATTYANKSFTDNKGQTWSGQCNIPDASHFGLRANDDNTHIASPVFSGNVKSVKAIIRNSSGSTRKVYLCSSNTTAKPSSGDLGGVTVDGSVTDVEHTFTISGAFNQFYMYTSGALQFNKIEVTYGSAPSYSNYSTTCTAAPKAEVNPTEVTTTAASVEGKVTVTYEHVNTANVAVALYNDAACTEEFTAGWLTVSLDGDKNVTYTVSANTLYTERKAYIKLTAPETTGATDPAKVVIPVTQAGKDKVFASLAELVAADLTAGDEVTVTLNNDVIKEFYIYSSKRCGVVFDVQKDGKDIKIFFNSQTTIDDWAVGGKLSGTLTNVKWTTYSSAWQLAPTNTWAWANLTYTEPKAVSTVVVSGDPTKTTYVDGEAFDPAGLTVTVNYNDATTEVNPTGVTFTVTPTTLAKGQTSVSVTATYNSVTSVAYEVTGLTVNDIPTKTVAEFIAAEGGRCYLEGIVSNITNTTYGNFDLTDASGKIYVYGCLNADGEKQKFATLGVKNGDKIKVIADQFKVYDEKDQATDVQYVSHISAATITIADITMEVGETKTIAATVVPAEAEVTYTIKENAANAISLSGNTITALAEGTATISANIAETNEYLAATVEFTVTVTSAEQEGEDDNIKTATLTFDNTSKRTTFTTSQQIWTENGVTLINDKSSSTSNVADYCKPARFYKNSLITIKHTSKKITKIVFDCHENDYADVLNEAIKGAGVMSDDEVTYTLPEAKESFAIFLTAGQVQLDAITVEYYSDGSETPTPTPDPIPGYNPVANPTTLSGVFSVAADKKVQFSTGNLQYEVGTNTWLFASKQYEVMGGAPYDPANPTNTNFGMNVPGYTGKLDLFAWSCDGKYGVNPSNTDSDYQGTFVDWGTLAGEGWFTLTKEEMNYILNRTKNGKKLWALATIDKLPGLILLPDNWNTNITLTYGYIPTQFVYNENIFTADEWEILEVAGAVFLPAAGSRTGGYGNKDNAGFKESYDANGDYFHVDNVGIYGYYWLNTQDPRPNFPHCASYLILPGWDEGPTVDEEGLDDLSTHPQVWSREKRRGNSVRLVKTVEEEPKMTVSGRWELVTDASLAIGDQVVIAAKDYNYALSTTQKENNRGQAAVTKHSDKTISFTEEVQVLTLEAGTVENTFAFNTGNGYLYAASSSGNHLKTQNTNNDNGIWEITITDGTASIVAQGTNTRNTMQYNQTSSLFACYASASQQAICLYRKKKVKVDNNQEATTNDIPNYSDVTVGSTGQLNVDEPLIVENLYIQTTMGAATSAQISNATNTNLLINGDVFIDITLGKNGDPNQWHAFTVPFPVDAMNGVYDLNDNKLTNEVNYAIMDYHGDLRANGQYGWKKYRGILVPGTFYLMTVDGERTTYRFKKVKDAELVAENNISLSAYTGGGKKEDQGWNGVGNPTLMHGKVGYKALILNPEFYIYEQIPENAAYFTVGTPFFIQAAENGTMTIAAETSASLAPARRAAAAVENIKVMLGNSDYTDRLYVSASEDAINEYEIGKDLSKMAMTSTPSVVQISALAYDTRLCMIDAPMANNEAVVALNLYAPANGEYTLSVQAQDNEKVYLLHEGTFVWDLSMSEYPITLNKGDNTGYSILVHRADAPTSVETIDGANNQTDKLIHNGNLYILHNGKVFDAVGTMLK